MANDPILPQPDVLNEAEYGKFVLTNLAAKRAKQIKEGAPPLVRIDSSHPLSIALAEIAAGKIKPLMGEEAEAAMAEQQLESLDDLSSDRFLLPGLDDDEALVDTIGHEEEESDDDEVGATSTSLLADLLGDDDLEDEVEVAEDDEEISLDDLAKQEEEEEEDQD